MVVVAGAALDLTGDDEKERNVKDEEKHDEKGGKESE